MLDPYSSPKELSLFESFVITSHLSSYHHKMMYNLAKDFKKIVKNDSKEAFKINARIYHATIAGKPLSQKTSELLDDIVDQPEKINQNSKFVQSLKDLKLYPNKNFPEWNQHIEIYNTLEKSNFSNSSTMEMYTFLNRNFFANEYKNLITLDLLQHRDFNIFLILFHLDTLIFKDNFHSTSLYKYFLVGKIKGKRKSSGHLFWNLTKVLAVIESTKKISGVVKAPDKIPKDEESFSLLNEKQAERIKYAVRTVKESQKIFILSHLYKIIGSEELHQDSICFNSFSLTGLWLIYIYSMLLIKPESILLKFCVTDLNKIYSAFYNSHKSEGTLYWPSDLYSYD
jgi:hypothetical protein